MAASDPLNAADYASGTNLARSRAAHSQGIMDKAVSEFLESQAKARKKAVAGDIAMLAGFLAPTALGALGAALGPGQVGAAEAGKAIAAGTASAAPGVSSVARTISQVGEGLKASQLRPALASAVGSAFGDPSPEVAGLTGLLEGISQRRRLGRREAETTSLMRTSRGSPEDLARLMSY